MSNEKAYLLHGSGTVGPFLTEAVPLRYLPNEGERYAKRGPIASHWQVRFLGKWRRVMISSGSPALFITAPKAISKERQRIRCVINEKGEA